MKTTTGQQLSLFDIKLDHNVEIPDTPPPTIIEPELKVKPNVDSKNLCPYKIPTVDEIIKMIDRSAYQISKSKLISDVFECGAIAVSNMVDFIHKDKREERYMQIINSYKPKEREILIEIFGKIYRLLTSVVYNDGKFDDYLGKIFMYCNQGNKHAGQFFTPYHISQLMAKITITDSEIQQGKIFSVCDPCCGGGGLAVAALDVLKNDYKVNYAMDCFIECADVDIRCVHMTYLQLALAGVPAVVKHQNTLSRELWSVWETPALIFQYPRFYKYLNH